MSPLDLIDWSLSIFFTAMLAGAAGIAITWVYAFCRRLLKS